MRIIYILSVHQHCIITASSAHHQCIIGTSLAHHQHIIRVSSAHHQRIISASSAHHQRIISTSCNVKCPRFRLQRTSQSFAQFTLSSSIKFCSFSLPLYHTTVLYCIVSHTVNSSWLREGFKNISHKKIRQGGEGVPPFPVTFVFV